MLDPACHNILLRFACRRMSLEIDESSISGRNEINPHVYFPPKADRCTRPSALHRIELAQLQNSSHVVFAIIHLITIVGPESRLLEERVISNGDVDFGKSRKIHCLQRHFRALDIHVPL